MAKKAKRRGRPPGAKSPDKMDIGQLRQYIEKLQAALGKKVSEQRAYFEAKLSELTGIGAPKRRGRPPGGGGTAKKKGTRRKATPEVSFEEGPEALVVRPRRDAGLDARGDEGHQAQEGRFPDRQSVTAEA